MVWMKKGGNKMNQLLPWEEKVMLREEGERARGMTEENWSVLSPLGPGLFQGNQTWLEVWK